MFKEPLPNLSTLQALISTLCTVVWICRSCLTGSEPTMMCESHKSQEKHPSVSESPESNALGMSCGWAALGVIILQAGHTCHREKITLTLLGQCDHPSWAALGSHLQVSAHVLYEANSIPSFLPTSSSRVSLPATLLSLFSVLLSFSWGNVESAGEVQEWWEDGGCRASSLSLLSLHNWCSLNQSYRLSASSGCLLGTDWKLLQKLLSRFSNIVCISITRYFGNGTHVKTQKFTYISMFLYTLIIIMLLLMLLRYYYSLAEYSWIG